MAPELPDDLTGLPADELARCWAALVDAVGHAEASRRWLAAFSAVDAAAT